MRPPLFILAPPRSFTSVVCAMVGQHPQMLGLPETNLFTRATYGEFSTVYRMRPRFQHGLLRAVAQLGLGEQTEETIEVAKTWLDHHTHLPTSALFSDLRQWASPRATVDKSPSYVYGGENLKRIRQAFPEARFLHLTREPRGTCESIYALRSKVREPMDRLKRVPGGGAGATAERRGAAMGDIEMSGENLWLRPHLEIMSFLETVPPEQQLLLRGEDLLSDPAVHLRTLCAWLELDDSAAAIDEMLHPERSPFACYGPANARFGNDPSFLENPALRAYTPKPVNLTDPLSWDSSLFFGEELKQVAQFFGYRS